MTDTDARKPEKQVDRLLLFGGTFDPPHMGHINNLKAALAAVCPDKTIIMPAGVPPHKVASRTAGAIRLQMCRCFLSCGQNIEISDWEIRQQGKSYTINTLEELHGRYPDTQLYLAVGSDMLLSFTQWRRCRDILALAVLVCTSRENGDADALARSAASLRKLGGRVILAPATPVPASSTVIRQGQYDPQILPPPVPELIEKYGLYRDL